MINDIVTDGHTAFVSTENNGLLVIEGQGTKKNKIAENGLGLALQPGEILWISTAKGNILRYDLHRKTLHSMDRECGLNGNSIYNITTDRKGKLWILTRQNVTIFSPEKQTFSTLRASSPHIDMENFLCMYKDSDDCFYIGDKTATCLSEQTLSRTRKRKDFCRVLPPSRSTPKQDLYLLLQRP